MTAVGSSPEPLSLLPASSGLACCVISAFQLTEAAEKPPRSTNEVDKVQSTNSIPGARTHISGSHKQSASSAAGSYMNDLGLHQRISCRRLKAQIGSEDLTEARVAGSYGGARGGRRAAGAAQCGEMRLGTGCCDRRRKESGVPVPTPSVPRVFHIRFRITPILISFQVCFNRRGLGGSRPPPLPPLS